MSRLEYTLFLSFTTIIALVAADCKDGCNVPTLVYEDLNCSPTYGVGEECCPITYNCSHIYNRPAETCNLRGTIYKPGEPANKELMAGRCDLAHCECGQGGEFNCFKPSDTCGEFWVPEWVKPGCYLTYELNRCCSNGQKCPPFEDKVKCEVNGVNYKEGQRFSPLGDECTLCICNKNFNGNFVAPFCQKRNCTTEVDYSKHIHNFCAPVYWKDETCCPKSWVCPSEASEYIPASTPPANQNLQCKYGERSLFIGEKVEQQESKFEKITCECLIPPYLTCITSL